MSYNIKDQVYTLTTKQDVVDPKGDVYHSSLVKFIKPTGKNFKDIAEIRNILMGNIFKLYQNMNNVNKVKDNTPPISKNDPKFRESNKEQMKLAFNLCNGDEITKIIDILFYKASLVKLVVTKDSFIPIDELRFDKLEIEEINGIILEYLTDFFILM